MAPSLTPQDSRDRAEVQRLTALAHNFTDPQVLGAIAELVADLERRAAALEKGAPDG